VSWKLLSAYIYHIVEAKTEGVGIHPGAGITTEQWQILVHSWGASATCEANRTDPESVALTAYRAVLTSCQRRKKLPPIALPTSSSV